MNPYITMNKNITILSALTVLALGSAAQAPAETNRQDHPPSLTVVGSFLMEGGGDFSLPWRPDYLVQIIRPADVLSLTFAVYSEHKDPSVRMNALNLASKTIQAACEAGTGLTFEVHDLDLALAGWKGLRILNRVRGNERSSFTATLYLDLSEDRQVFEQMAELADLVADIELPDDVETVFVDSGLGIRNPEAYRKDLLNELARSLDQLKTALGEDIAFRITGTTEPLKTHMVNDRQVALSLPVGVEVNDRP